MSSNVAESLLKTPPRDDVQTKIVAAGKVRSAFFFFFFFNARVFVNIYKLTYLFFSLNKRFASI